MSFSHDAVTVFKNKFLSARQKHEGKLPEEEPPTIGASPATAPSLLEQSLLAVARDGADIRRNHDAILAKAASLSTLQDDLLEAFDRAYQAIDDLAEARSLLAKAEAVAKFERDERAVAAQRLASMTAAYHQSVSEVEKLRPEAKRLEASLRQTSDRLLQQEAEVANLGEQLKEARAEIERLRGAEAMARREHDAVAAELGAANAFIARKMAETSQLVERCEIAEQSARASAKALDDARAESASALVRLDEERVNLASSQSRISALEAQLKDLGGKFSAAGAGWSQEAERFNETVGRLREELAQANGRSEAHQRLLTAAQNEANALRSQNADLEAQLAEAGRQLGQTAVRAESAESARDDLAREVVASKRLHQSLLRRVKPMISALREKNAESQRLAATHVDLERRFLDYQSEAAEAIRMLQDKEAQLIADLEAERARRVVAEGALAIDRSLRPSEAQRRRAPETELPRLTSAGAAAATQTPPREG